MDSKKTLGNSIRMVSGWILSGAAMADFIAFVWFLYVAYKESEWDFVLYAVATLIGGLLLLLLMGVLLSGFAQIVDDLHAIRKHLMPCDDDVEKEVAFMAWAEKVHAVAVPSKEEREKPQKLGRDEWVCPQCERVVKGWHTPCECGYEHTSKTICIDDEL